MVWTSEVLFVFSSLCLCRLGFEMDHKWFLIVDARVNQVYWKKLHSQFTVSNHKDSVIWHLHLKDFIGFLKCRCRLSRMEHFQHDSNNCQVNENLFIALLWFKTSQASFLNANLTFTSERHWTKFEIHSKTMISALHHRLATCIKQWRCCLHGNARGYVLVTQHTLIMN